MKVLGIDLGTSSSAAAVMIDGNVQIIPFEDKYETQKPLPSVVSFFEDGTGLIGTYALEQAHYNPKGTVFNIKREIGTGRKITVFGKEILPQYVSALILLKIKLYAEKFLKEKVEKAVITVPSDFNDAQRQATKDAGKIAGLDVVQVLPEQEAAVIAHDLKSLSGITNILVFDIGAGTTDVSVIQVDDGFVEVLSTEGDSKTGGIDIDKIIKSKIISSISKKSQFVGLDEILESQINKISEKIKIELSTKTKITVNETLYSSEKLIQISFTYSRDQLENEMNDILKRCETCVKKAIKNASMVKSDIDKVILIGGPTKMPIIRKLLTDLVKNPEEKVDGTFAVCRGAAIQGAILGDAKNLPVIYSGLTLLSTTALDYGEEAKKNGVRIIEPMIPKNTPYPTEITKSFWINNRPMVESTSIDVWQGDFEKSKEFVDNTKIGHFDLSPLSIGTLHKEIQVTYKIDADGILNIVAKELTGNAVGEMNITRHGIGITPPPQIEELKKEVKKSERNIWRNIMNPYEIPIEEYYTMNQNKNDSKKFCWMCECLEKAKKIILQYHSTDCTEFFKNAKFPISIQLDKQYAYGYIHTSGGLINPIGIHNSLKENTSQNQRMLVIVFVHELLHAIHPDWGHDKIKPEERRLANLGMYYDALHEMEILFLSGKMCLCNNEISPSEESLIINCENTD